MFLCKVEALGTNIIGKKQCFSVILTTFWAKQTLYM